MSEEQLALRHVPFEQMQQMAKAIADSKMFGAETEAQAMALMLLCQAEGLHPIMALRRYHLIDGKPAFRADALQGEFEKEGAILWHERNEKVCAATFFRDKRAANDEAVKRAKERYRAAGENEPTSHLAAIGEVTIIRTFKDAEEKRLACTWKDGKWILKKNWAQSPRQMLHWRCLTEGVRAINPGLIAGVYSEDEIIDISQTEYDLPIVTTSPVESNIAQAITNRGIPEGVIVENGSEITSENYGDIICHIGKAEGPILGRKVSEIPRAPLEWLHRNFGVKWGTPSNEKDLRLKKAIDFATAVEEKARFAPEPSKEPEDGLFAEREQSQSSVDFVRPPIQIDWREVVIDAPIKSKVQGKKLGEMSDDLLASMKTQLIDAANWSHEDVTASQKKFRAAYELAAEERGFLMDVDQIKTDLLERAENIVLTEAQLVKYMRQSGILDKGDSLSDVSEQTLRFVYLPENWQILVNFIASNAKPKTSVKKSGR